MHAGRYGEKERKRWINTFHEGKRDVRRGRIQSNVINSPRFVRFDYSTPVQRYWHAPVYFHFSLFDCHVIALFSFLFFLFFPILFCSFRRSVLLIGEKGGNVKIIFFKRDNKVKNNYLTR